ncbi:MAG TPA: AbrB/MazE/SpoVT family DNA-binding domain-containing protein [Terracidiphilus sp.]|jgi:antitoxin component of MazEF toxin-antitoxin module|nr:AbrB/MazE/SpoVT family DNA-binding domain-containing protein [Terracidiphilus sp.]
METMQFKLPIGAKRQVTLPKRFMDQLSLDQNSELLLQVVGDRAILEPVVSVPRRDLPEELRQKFESRRGAKSSDIPLERFLDEIAHSAAQIATSPPGHSARKRKRAVR